MNKNTDRTDWPLEATVFGEAFAVQLGHLAREMNAATNSTFRVGCRGERIKMPADGLMPQHYKIGPAKYYENPDLRGSKTKAEYSSAVAALFATELLVFARDAAFAVVRDAVASIPSHVLRVNGKCNHQHLIQMLQQAGEQSNRITTLIATSTVGDKTLQNEVRVCGQDVHNICGMSVYRNCFRGLDVCFCDARSLLPTFSGTPSHVVLGLGGNSVSVDLSTESPIECEPKTGEHGPYMLIERKCDARIAIEGMAWDSDTKEWTPTTEDPQEIPLVKGVFSI